MFYPEGYNIGTSKNIYGSNKQQGQKLKMCVTD